MNSQSFIAENHCQGVSVLSLPRFRSRTASRFSGKNLIPPLFEGADGSCHFREHFKGNGFIRPHGGAFQFGVGGHGGGAAADNGGVEGFGKAEDIAHVVGAPQPVKHNDERGVHNKSFQRLVTLKS